MSLEFQSHFRFGLSQAAASKPSVVAIGAFDGVHLGHQAILRQAVTKAKVSGAESTALFFEPLPREYFSGETAPQRIQSLREKVESIRQCGIDRVVCLRFNAALSALSPQAFVESILVNKLKARDVIVGEDFRFGSNREGGKALFMELAAQHGFEITRPEDVEVDGERASSTRIRHLLTQANFEKVAQLLGRPFSLSGRVHWGKQLGRQLGVPTANVALHRKQVPVLGTFVVKVDVGETKFIGVTNIGVRPTVNQVPKPHMETHLLDFDDDLYGQCIKVTFYKKLRDEKRFDSIDQLKMQIQNDIESAREFFSS